MGVSATTVKDVAKAATKIRTSVARSRVEAFQGLVGTAVTVVVIAPTFQLS